MTTWIPHTNWAYVFHNADTHRLQALDDILSLDSPPIRVNPDGTLTEEMIPAPDAFDMGTDDADVIGQARSAGWELLTGYSGYIDGYTGPVMHTSETLSGLGGDMARTILATPAVYAVASVDDADDGYPVGWVLMRKV